jgi:hypothetical protein
MAASYALRLTLFRVYTTMRSCNCRQCPVIAPLRKETGSCREKVSRPRCAISSRYLCANHGDREMQAFLIGYILISICEIFSVGEFPLDSKVRLVSKRPN